MNLKEQIAEWLYEDGESIIEIDGHDFEMVYADTSKGQRYELWHNNAMIGWVDCHSYFRDMDQLILATVKEKKTKIDYDFIQSLSMDKVKA